MPKIIDHDQRRREIVEVAKRLILEGGFEAATMRSIVTAAGFANGALKHYFPSKDSIVAATFESVLAEMGQQTGWLDTDLEPVTRLRTYVSAAMPLDAYRIASSRVLLALWEHSVSNQDLARRYREHLSTWRTQLAELIVAARARGESADDPAVTALADEIVSASIGASVKSLMFPEGALIGEYTAYLERFLERTLA